MPSSQPKNRFQELIDAVWTMTLATSGETGPWSAPVYYLYREKRFYFFSNPASRHILEGDGRPCAASIFRVHERVDHLEGIQMSGVIHSQKPGIRSAGAAGAYARRFGIPVPGADFLTFFQNAFHARLYAFLPDQVYHMDNRKGFGNREIIQL
ncbi:pyridoxamine 5'-phosphate oxidase family protein [Desulfotignum phosphitoxidans]|nr:pyridoxamine 5'-phosphate oxidase family protein [Desulfotignum phosphitoxidans]